MKSRIHDAAASEGPSYAKAAPGKRLQAAAVDYLLLPLVGTGFFLSAHLVHRWLGLLVLGLSAGAWLAYCLVKDGIFEGESIGKYVAGLMVVDLGTDRPSTVKASILRSIPLFVPGLNLAECVMVLLNRKGRRIGDMLAKTMVVSKVDYLVRHSPKE